MKENKKSIMFIAGDPSGDEHASWVIARLKTMLPEVEFFGIGGYCMQSKGLKALMPFDSFNVMGIGEVLKHLPFFLKAKYFLKKQLKSKKPLALVCIDYPGLNIPLMKEAYKLKIPVVWYIVPQVWAWKKKRAEILGKYASYIATILPFEKKYFDRYSSCVEFVGHPLVEQLEREGIKTEKKIGIKNKDKINLALVPGSRKQEIENLLCIMIDSAIIIKKQIKNVFVTISKFKGLPDDIFIKNAEKYLKTFSDSLEICDKPLFDILNNSDCAIVTSGTATLQTALMGVPMVIAYKTSWITYNFFKRMIKIPYIGLPNIIAGEKIVPECIQNNANSEKIATEITKFIYDEKYFTETSEKLLSIRKSLSSKYPSQEVSSAISIIAMREL